MKRERDASDDANGVEENGRKDDPAGGNLASRAECADCTAGDGWDREEDGVMQGDASDGDQGGRGSGAAEAGTMTLHGLGKDSGEKATWTQKEAARALGVAVPTLRKMREEVGPVSEEEMKDLAARLGVAVPTKKDGEDEGDGAAAWRSEGKTGEGKGVGSEGRKEALSGRVHMLHKNRRIVSVRVELENGPAVVRMRVRDSENFVAGMEVPLRHVAADLYECERRAPRWRGKW